MIAALFFRQILAEECFAAPYFVKESVILHFFVSSYGLGLLALGLGEADKASLLVRVVSQHIHSGDDLFLLRQIFMVGRTLQPGGIAFINSSIVPDKVTRDDIRAIYVPCDAIAAELGNPKVANMVMLGAYVGATEALKVETIEEMIHEMFTGKKAKLVPLNLEALQRGIACAKEQLA